MGRTPVPTWHRDRPGRPQSGPSHPHQCRRRWCSSPATRLVGLASAACAGNGIEPSAGLLTTTHRGEERDNDRPCILSNGICCQSPLLASPRPPDHAQDRVQATPLTLSALHSPPRHVSIPNHLLTTATVPLVIPAYRRSPPTHAQDDRVTDTAGEATSCGAP